MNYKEIDGDLIKLALEGKFDIIAHGCNCFCTMGAGLAPQMAKAFGCDTFPMEDATLKGDINKLGQIDYEVQVLIDQLEPPEGKELVIVNCYSQYGFGKNHAEGSVAPLDYEALRLCLKKINHLFPGKTIGLPKIGCHLAGGIWDSNDWGVKQGYSPRSYLVKDMIQEELKDMNIVIVNYKP